MISGFLRVTIFPTLLGTVLACACLSHCVLLTAVHSLSKVSQFGRKAIWYLLLKIYIKMPQLPLCSGISISRCRIIMKAGVWWLHSMLYRQSPEQCLVESKCLINKNESINKLSAWNLAHCHLSTWIQLARNMEE